jgi:hypothetical protein
MIGTYKLASSRSLVDVLRIAMTYGTKRQLITWLGLTSLKRNPGFSNNVFGSWVRMVEVELPKLRVISATMSSHVQFTPFKPRDPDLDMM